jgi:hypothetical protein
MPFGNQTMRAWKPQRNKLHFGIYTRAAKGSPEGERSVKVKREKALAVFEIGDKVKVREITPTGLGDIKIDGNIVHIRLAQGKQRMLVLELNTGHAIELSSWNLHEQEVRK